MKSISLKPRAVPKKVTPRRPKFADERYLGPEPDENVVVESDMQVMAAMKWYNYFYETVDCQKWLVEYMKRNQYEEKDVQIVRNLAAWKTSKTYAVLAHLMNRGWVLPERMVKNTKMHINYLITNNKVESRDEDASKNNVHERTKEKAVVISAILLDEYIDKYLEGETPPSFYDILIKEKISPVALLMMKEKAQAILEDFNHPEAFEGWSKKRLRDAVTFYENILADIERHTFNKKASKVRKPRKVKAKPVEKIVAKVKYRKDLPELKLVSIQPQQVIKATTLWTYNAKYRQLAVYVAKDDNGLNIKGTSILNYDETQSIMKRVRKPEIFTKEVLSIGKVPLRKLMDKINTAATPAKGRLNEDTLLLRVT